MAARSMRPQFSQFNPRAKRRFDSASQLLLNSRQPASSVQSSLLRWNGFMATPVRSRSALLASGCLLLSAIASAQEPGIDPNRLPGIVVDDSAAKLEGTWEKSVHTRPF